jgi:hypothetical protein
LLDHQKNQKDAQETENKKLKLKSKQVARKKK